MAFSSNRFVRQTTAFNAGQITTTFNPEVGAVVENGPAWFTYASATDAVATIAAANYFAEVVYDLSVNDRIDVTGSDASNMYIVSAVDRDAGTVSLVSYSATAVVGTADIQDLAVTTGKIAANAVTSAKLSKLALQYVAVPITAVAFNGMYAAPVVLVAAGGANTLIVLDKVQLLMTYATANYASGGVAAVQYDVTANGAGVIASTTLAAATFQAAASTAWNFNAGVVAETFSTCVNKSLALSNITGAFTTGDSAMVAHVWYKVIPTV